MSDRHRQPRRAVNATTAAARILAPTHHDAPEPEPWHVEAWAMRDVVGELRFAESWLAAAMGRARLFAAKRPEPGSEPEPIETGPAFDLVEKLAGGVGGQSSLLASFASYLLIPGVGYLVGEAKEHGESFMVVNAEDIKLGKAPESGDQAYEVREGEQSGDWRMLPENSVVTKVYRPHPRHRWEPDSPTRAALPILRELLLLTQHVEATATSRLAGSGMQYFPAEMELPGGWDKFVDDWVAAQVRPIKDRAATSAKVPFPMRVPGEFLQWMQNAFVTYSTPFDTQALALREEAVGRLANAMPMPRPVLTGEAQNHWGCADDRTEILTVDGWRTHDQVEPGTLVLTLDHDTGLSRWRPVQAMSRYEVDTDLVSIEGRGHSSLTTGNHRWPTLYQDGRRWRTSDTLREMDRLVTAAPCAELPREPKWSDALVELVAWFWTEGNTNGNQVTIAQSHTRNPHNVARIRAALRSLWGPPHPRATLRGSIDAAWREVIQTNRTSHGGPVTVFRLNHEASERLRLVARGKRVAPWFIRGMTRAQLELFIDASLAGDGWHYRRGDRDIWQRDPRLLDGLELAGILAGYMVTRRAYDGGETLTLSTKTTLRPVKAARNAARHSRPGCNIGQRHYRGVVWCPTVETGTWLARRAGTVYFTGNSWQVEEAGLKGAVEPNLEVVADGLTVGYLTPGLSAAEDTSEAARQAMDQVLADTPLAEVLIWYDTSDLRVRPDRGPAAQEAYDRFQADGTALRKELGLSEAEPWDPADEETQRVILLTHATSPQSPLAEVALKKLGILTDDDLPEPPMPAPGTPGMSPPGPGPEPPASPDGLPVEGERTLPETREAPPPSQQPRTLPVRAADVVVPDDVGGVSPGVALVGACYTLVDRALEVAGKRVLSKLPATDRPAQERCPASRLHTCLDTDQTMPVTLQLVGAWDRLPDVADRLDEDLGALRAALDAHVRELIATRTEHTWDGLAEALGVCPCEAET